MSTAKRFAAALMPWAGLVGGSIASAIVHQFGSEGVFNDCRTVSPWPLLIVAVFGLVASAAAGFASWRAGGSSRQESRRIIATISAGMAALFAFGIVLAMIAALLLPPCFQ